MSNYSKLNDQFKSLQADYESKLTEIQTQFSQLQKQIIDQSSGQVKLLPNLHRDGYKYFASKYFVSTSKTSDTIVQLFSMRHDIKNWGGLG